MSGADVMEGWVGNDIYFVDDPGDLVIDFIGHDHVKASVDWTLAAGLDDLTLLGSAVTAIGNSGDNALVGTANANILDGRDGRDILTGGAGADVFVIREPVSGSRADVITDFNVAQGDRLALPSFMFGDNHLPDVEIVTSFTHLQSAFRTDADLVYNSRNGYLYYNGNGSSHGMGSDGGLLAVFSNRPAEIASFVPIPDPHQDMLSSPDLLPLLSESPLTMPGQAV